MEMEILSFDQWKKLLGCSLPHIEKSDLENMYRQYLNKATSQVASLIASIVHFRESAPHSETVNQAIAIERKPMSTEAMYEIAITLKTVAKAALS